MDCLFEWTCPVDLRAALWTKPCGFGSVGSVTDRAGLCVLAFTTPGHGRRRWIWCFPEIGETPGQDPDRITHPIRVLNQSVSEIFSRPAVRQGGLDGR